MASRICKTCDLRFPAGPDYSDCPGCGEMTVWQPHMGLWSDWKERLHAHLGLKTELDVYRKSGFALEDAWHSFALALPPSLEVFDHALEVQNSREMYDLHPEQMAQEWAERTKWESSSAS